MLTVIVLLLFTSASFIVECQAQVATRTYWQYLRGPSTFTRNPAPGRTQHGDPNEFSTNGTIIPDANDPQWASCAPTDSFCKSGDNLGIVATSRLPGCWTWLDFSFFQTIVYVPPGVVVTEFSIQFTQMDDGAQISIFSSIIQGLVPHSNVYLNQPATSNLVNYIGTGYNRVVITQVDDCAVGNDISATVNLNGNFVPPTCNSNACQTATWDSSLFKCVYTNRDDGTTCDDFNMCTTGDSCTNGVCGGEQVYCDSMCGQSAGPCNPTTGLCPASASKKKCYCTAMA